MSKSSDPQILEPSAAKAGVVQIELAPVNVHTRRPPGVSA